MSLRWPAPETPAAELELGAEVTAYLLGSRTGRIEQTRFTPLVPASENSSYVPLRIRMRDNDTRASRAPFMVLGLRQRPHWPGCTGPPPGTGGGSGEIHTSISPGRALNSPSRWRVTIGQSGIVTV